MVRGTITPYSDLEFAILIEDGKDKDPEVLKYFRNLSHYVHFKVICLGETVIPGSWYDTNWLDNIIKSTGVSLDLGLKVPLGKEHEYELICTVDEMMKYVQDESGDKNLPYMLEKACYVHGDEQLFNKYKQELIKFQSEVSPVNKNGLSIPNAEQRIIRITKNDLSRLIPKFKFNEHPLDIKLEMYRLPDILIDSLGEIFLQKSIIDMNGWKIIELLIKNNILNKNTADILTQAFTWVNILRENYYTKYGYRQNILSNNDLIEFYGKINESNFYQNKEDRGESGNLFQYYLTIPLAEKMLEFCKKSIKKEFKTLKEKQEFFKNINFDDNYFRIKTLVCFRLFQVNDLMRYLTANLCLLAEKKELENNDLLRVYEIVNHIIYIFVEYKKFFKKGIKKGLEEGVKHQYEFALMSLEKWLAIYDLEMAIIIIKVHVNTSTDNKLVKLQELSLFYKNVSYIMRFNEDNNYANRTLNAVTTFNNLKKEREDLEKEQEDLEKGLEDCKKVLENFKKKLEEDENIREDLEKGLEDHEKVLEDLKKNLEDRKKVLEENENIREGCENALKNCKQELEDRKKRLEEDENTLKNCKKELEDYQNVREDYQNVLKEYELPKEHYNKIFQEHCEASNNETGINNKRKHVYLEKNKDNDESLSKKLKVENSLEHSGYEYSNLGSDSVPEILGQSYIS